VQGPNPDYRLWEQAFGTLYTAAYRSANGQVEFRWPSASWMLSFNDFAPGEARIVYAGD
jgi:hypothetical protein